MLTEISKEMLKEVFKERLKEIFKERLKEIFKERLKETPSTLWEQNHVQCPIAHADINNWRQRSSGENDRQHNSQQYVRVKSEHSRETNKSHVSVMHVIHAVSGR